MASELEGLVLGLWGGSTTAIAAVEASPAPSILVAVTSIPSEALTSACTT